MTIADSAWHATAKAGAVRNGFSPNLARLLFSGTMAGIVALTFAAADADLSAQAVASAGDDLTRLLRFMAVIKGGLALGAAGAVLWRLGTPVSLATFAAYGLAGGAMFAGPGLIWAMVHVGPGALLLHGGLLATLLLLWRDPGVASRLDAVLARRRRRAGGRPR